MTRAHVFTIQGGTRNREVLLKSFAKDGNGPTSRERVDLDCLNGLKEATKSTA